MGLLLVSFESDADVAIFADFAQRMGATVDYRFGIVTFIDSIDGSKLQNQGRDLQRGDNFATTTGEKSRKTGIKSFIRCKKKK